MIRDEVRIMLVTRISQQQQPYPVSTGSLYLYTDDADRWWVALKDQVTTEYPISSFAYSMRELAFRNLNGYQRQIETYAAKWHPFLFHLPSLDQIIC